MRAGRRKVSLVERASILMGLETDSFRKTLVYWRLSGVCACVCVWLTNINTLSLTRDQSRSQLDLILISCFTLLLFFGKTFTQQARQISVHKYVIKNSQREILLRSTPRRTLMLNVLQRPEEMTLFARFSPPTTNQVVFQSKLSFFLISLNTSYILSFSFWSSFILTFFPPL